MSILFIILVILSIVGLYTLISAALDAAEKLTENREVKESVRAYKSRIAKINAMPDEDRLEANIQRELNPIFAEVNGTRVPLKVRFKGQDTIQTPTADMRQCINAGLIPGKLYDIDYLDIGSYYTDFAIRGIKGQLFNSVNFEMVLDDGYYTVIEPYEYDKYALNGYVSAAQPLNEKVQRLWDEVAARRDEYAAAMARTMSC